MSARLLNVVLDIETLSTEHNAAIIQIGACVPNFDKQYVSIEADYAFEATIRYEDTLVWVKDGLLDMSDSTMKWWETQPTRTQVFSGQTSYIGALEMFRDWVTSLGIPIAIWGNSPAFDCSILEHSCKVFNVEVPWEFRNERDFRTLKALFPMTSQEAALTLSELEAKHTALGDARYEARILDYLYEHNVLGI